MIELVFIFVLEIATDLGQIVQIIIIVVVLRPEEEVLSLLIGCILHAVTEHI